MTNVAKKKKKNASLLGEIVAKAQENTVKDPKDLTKEKGLVSHEIDYESTFDFGKYEVQDLQEVLVRYEEAVVYNTAKTIEHRFNVAKALYEVNKKLAKRGNGVYTAWCENLNISREKSSVYIKRYELYLETNNDRVKSLPEVIIKGLSKEGVSSEDIFKVIEAKDPKEAFKSLSGDLTNSNLIELKPYDPKETEKKFKKVSKVFRSVSLKKIDDQNSDSFDKDMEKIMKILSKWQVEKQETGN